MISKLLSRYIFQKALEKLQNSSRKTGKNCRRNEKFFHLYRFFKNFSRLSKILGAYFGGSPAARFRTHSL